MSIIKGFFSWIQIKSRLHYREYELPFFSEGEMWWAHVGENVGFEVNGKGQQFTRPVVIFKKLSKYTFLAVPITTSQKQGSWYVSFYYRGKQTAVLSQVRVISSKRLREKMGLLANADFKKIRLKFKELYCGPRK